MEQTSETPLHSNARPKFPTASSSASFSKPFFLKPTLLEVQAMVGPRAVPSSLYPGGAAAGTACTQGTSPGNREQPHAPTRLYCDLGKRTPNSNPEHGDGALAGEAESCLRLIPPLCSQCRKLSAARPSPCSAPHPAAHCLTSFSRSFSHGEVTATQTPKETRGSQ